MACPRIVNAFIADLIFDTSLPDRQLESLKFADTAVAQWCAVFPWLIVISEFDAFANAGMVGPEGQKESTPFGRKFGLSIPDEYHCRSVVLVSQFKAKAVGFVFAMPGDQIEKRQKCKPEEGQQEHDQWK